MEVESDMSHSELLAQAVTAPDVSDPDGLADESDSSLIIKLREMEKKVEEYRTEKP